MPSPVRERRLLLATHRVRARSTDKGFAVKGAISNSRASSIDTPVDGLRISDLGSKADLGAGRRTSAFTSDTPSSQIRCYGKANIRDHKKPYVGHPLQISSVSAGRLLA